MENMQRKLDLLAFIFVFILFTDGLVLADKKKFSTWIKSSSDFPWNVFVFETLLRHGIEGCFEACKAKKMCEYVNYNVREKSCYLVGTTSTFSTTRASIFNPDDNIEKKAGYVLGRKRDWALEKYEVCSDCESHGACRREETPTVKYPACQNTGCGPPEKKEFAVVRGNMFSMGDTVKYECEEGFTAMTGETETSTCQDSGHWTLSTFRCLPSTCFQGYCYLLDRNQRSWQDAASHCERLGGYLTDIKTEEEWTYINNIMLDSDDLTGACWIGGNDLENEGDFRWLDGTAVSDGYNNWYPGEPNNNLDIEDCTSVRTFWNDAPCALQYWSICKF